MTALRIIKHRGHRILQIPASVDVNEIRVDRKLTKLYGMIWRIPLTLDDAKLIYKKSRGIAKIKHRKGYKTVFIDGGDLGFDGVIFVVGLPKKTSLTVRDGKIQIYTPKHHKKVVVLALGDAGNPVSLDSVVEFNYVKH